MVTQHILHINCSDHSHQLTPCESPHFVGPVDFAWNHRQNDEPTILGCGPFAGTCMPGASALVVAGRSPLWDGFYCTTIPGSGISLASLGISMIALAGKAPQHSVLVLKKTGDQISCQFIPLEAHKIWNVDQQGTGIYGLINHLADSYIGNTPTAHILATGPAAALTPYGALAVARFDNSQKYPVIGWSRRGGLGSRLYSHHHLSGIVILSDVTLHELQQVGLVNGAFLGRFLPQMTTSELEAIIHCEFDPKMKAWGELGATLAVRGRWMLWGNASSIYLSDDERNVFQHHVWRPHYVSPLIAELAQPDTHFSCGEACPLKCKRVLRGQNWEVEPHLACGPQLGIFSPQDAEATIHHHQTLGFDSLTLGNITAWVMERLFRNALDPATIHLQALPHWAMSNFDPVAHSQLNGQIARVIADGILYAEWGKPLQKGLRHAASLAADASSEWAIYLANGPSGEMAIPPYWPPGFYTPMPISGEYHQYYGGEFVAPRELGRKSAQRMIAELFVQNLGFCRLHRAWAEEMLPDLLNQFYHSQTDWDALHRKLAQNIFRTRQARYWETQRSVEIVATFLKNYHYSAAPDAVLDRWVRRFHEDVASASRAYGSEINAGLEEILGS